jgi:hypothetical protein
MILEKEKMVKGIIDKNRAIALDQAFLASRLLDEKHFPKVMEALIEKNEKGPEIFKGLCSEAGIPPDMAGPLWESVKVYAATAKAPWAP